MDRITPISIPADLVTVEAPARLHMGFIDLHGGLGRRFGSVGLCIDGLATRVRASRAAALTVNGPEAARAARYAAAICQHYALADGLAITIEEAIPEHVGLGSGTQLALAVGAAILRLHGITPDSREIARVLDRGGRSGIGIGAFDTGGFLLDGGRDEQEGAPHIISRVAFPDAWRVLLVLDEVGQGVHGKQEIEAFRKLPPFPAEKAAHLCRLTLMQMLPALAAGDCDGFGHAVTELQETVGDHFAPAQGGRYASAPVAAVIEWLKAQGVAGVGQSSWGPTGFAILPSEADARAIKAQLEARQPEQKRLRYVITTGRNQGGLNSVVPRLNHPNQAD